MGVPTPVWKTAGYEHPNAVAALMAKRDELVKVRARLEDDLRRLTCDIDHLEGSIRVFDPEPTPEAIQRYLPKYRAKGGHLRRYLLNRMREATAPVTTLELADGWMAERAIPMHHANHVIVRRRIGATIMHLMHKGLVRAIPTETQRKLYELVRE